MERTKLRELTIALRMCGFNINEEHTSLALKVIDGHKKQGDSFSIADVSKIMAENEVEYESLAEKDEDRKE